MTPKEKAKDLIETFYQTMLITIQGASSIQRQQAKRAALILVDEMLDWGENSVTNDDAFRTTVYWFAVKDEIEKI
jgi:hypothetical protein